MRRALSIFLILSFWLGPVVAFLPASDESRLPPCCRRHGAHHCAMSQRMRAEMTADAAGKPAFNAPATCPLFPGYRNVPTAPAQALAAAGAALPVLLLQTHPPATGRAAALISQIRTRAGRGPPSTAVA
ncbi:MAG: hypothetical protein ABR956_05725 [Terracidiphilus sp.]|jgi:hypothetical protein